MRCGDAKVQSEDRQETEANEASFGENGAVEFRLVRDLLESSGHVTADINDLEVRTKVEKLQLASDGGGADDRS